MFARSITLFRLFGFNIRIDFSWIILALLITWTLAVGYFPANYTALSTTAYWIMGVIGALGLFASIIAHEFAHSLVARKYALRIKGITLFVFGGVAEMPGEPSSPKAEFYIAVVGPLSSFCLGLGFYLLHLAGIQMKWPVPVQAVLLYLFYINIILGCFNLIPAFPLDGGRILRAALWRWMGGIRKATHIASQIGSGFAIALLILGALNMIAGSLVGGLWWMLLGLFLRSASKIAYQQVWVRELLQGEKVKDFMKTDPVTVSPDMTLEEVADNYIYRHHFKMYPVMQNGSLQGCITLSDIKSVPRDQWAHKKVAELVRQGSPQNSVSPDEDVVQALSIMKNNAKSRLLVIRENKLAGILALKDLLNFLSLKLDLEYGESLA